MPRTSNLPVCTKRTKRPGSALGLKGDVNTNSQRMLCCQGGSTQGGLVGYHPGRVPGKPRGCAASLPSRKHYSWFTFPNIQADESERSIKRHLAFSALSRDCVEGERWFWKEQMYSPDS